LLLYFLKISRVLVLVIQQTMYEHYFANDLEFKGDVLDTMRNHRRQFLAFRFNLSHVKFFVTQWVPELLAHTKAQDESQVREHYDRGST
jgi:sphingolipid C9-methyltransferase